MAGHCGAASLRACLARALHCGGDALAFGRRHDMRARTLPPPQNRLPSLSSHASNSMFCHPLCPPKPTHLQCTSSGHLVTARHARSRLNPRLTSACSRQSMKHSTLVHQPDGTGQHSAPAVPKCQNATPRHAQRSASLAAAPLPGQAAEQKGPSRQPSLASSGPQRTPASSPAPPAAPGPAAQRRHGTGSGGGPALPASACCLTHPTESSAAAPAPTK